MTEAMKSQIVRLVAFGWEQVGYSARCYMKNGWICVVLSDGYIDFTRM